MARSHAIERQVERMVRVDMRKISPIHKFTQSFARIALNRTILAGFRPPNTKHR